MSAIWIYAPAVTKSTDEKKGTQKQTKYREPPCERKCFDVRVVMGSYSRRNKPSKRHACCGEKMTAVAPHAPRKCWKLVKTHHDRLFVKSDRIQHIQPFLKYESLRSTCTAETSPGRTVEKQIKKRLNSVVNKV